jgi:L-fuculose-phosphate aldolase
VVEKVLSNVSYLEYICDVQLRAMSSGRTPRVLDAQEIAEVARRLSGYGQSAAAAMTEKAQR